jgi:hypothetical protein
MAKDEVSFPLLHHSFRFFGRGVLLTGEKSWYDKGKREAPKNP